MSADEKRIERYYLAEDGMHTDPSGHWTRYEDHRDALGEAEKRSVTNGEALMRMRTRAEAAEKLLEVANGRLADCYRLSGEDPDAASDSMLADMAVQAVRDMRRHHDEDCAEELERREAAEKSLEALREQLRGEIDSCLRIAEEGAPLRRQLWRIFADRLTALLDRDTGEDS